MLVGAKEPTYYIWYKYYNKDIEKLPFITDITLIIKLLWLHLHFFSLPMTEEKKIKIKDKKNINKKIDLIN